MLFRRQKTSGGGFTECFRGGTIEFELEVAWHREGQWGQHHHGESGCREGKKNNFIGCTATTIDVNATWTGVGAIFRGTFNTSEHSQYDGVKVTISSHFNGTNRNATAKGIVAGLTLTTNDLSFAALGSTNYGSTTVCIGSGC